MHVTRVCTVVLSSFVMASGGCFDGGPGSSGGETTGETQTSGDGDGDASGDGDGDASGDGDPSGDGDGDPSGDGDGDASGDGDGEGPMCTPEQTECEGECVDLDNDPEHCGECGRSCLGAACIAGTCEPIELASGKGRLFMVEVDPQGHVYYGGDGVDVGRIDTDGTNDMVLVPAGDNLDEREWCYQWAYTGSAVVWGNDWVQPGVRGCATPDCDGGVTTFFAGSNLFAMVYDANNSRLYWTQGADIVSAAWPNGGITTFVATDTPNDLASDGDFIYWVSRLGNTDFRIRKRGVGGGNVTELVLDRPGFINGLTATESKIFWGESDGVYEAPLPNGIGGADPIKFAEAGSIRDIAADSFDVYWTSTQDGVGTVSRCPIEGCEGPPEVLAQVPQPWGITYDPDAVYFVTEMGSVFKIAK